MEESNIATTSIILKQTADELGISIRKVELVYEAIISFLRKACAYSSAIAVFLPHLGTLYLRVGTFYNKLNRLQAKEKLTKKEQSRLKYLLKKKVVMDKYLTEYKKHRYIGRSYHVKSSKLHMKIYTGGKNLDEIEEFQNSRNSK